MRETVVQEKEAGQRLFKFLEKYMSEAPKSFLYKMLRKKNITLNGKKADGSERLEKGDRIRCFLADETIEKFQKKDDGSYPVTNLDVLYEDEDVIFLNKPAGMLSQKAKPDDVSLVEYLTGYLLAKGELTRENLATFKPGICNRLDRNTSGIVIGGKTVRGLAAMSALLRERDLDKYYFCIVKGHMAKGQVLDGYLKKDEGTNRVEILSLPAPGADPIRTAYEPLRSNGFCTLVQVELITGKSHQIRAHLASLGHPVLGDAKYGDAKTNRRLKEKYRIQRQMLHACRLILPKDLPECPKAAGRMIVAPMPPDMVRVIKGEDLICRPGEAEG
ncbi:MAG: RluA family pseudouridine synthase [Lachnospiraceae bacterium]|nr:RluA family pseudouridine synthase [Lachnospiraceae bacterium]